MFTHSFLIYKKDTPFDDKPYQTETLNAPLLENVLIYGEFWKYENSHDSKGKLYGIYYMLIIPLSQAK